MGTMNNSCKLLLKCDREEKTCRKKQLSNIHNLLTSEESENEPLLQSCVPLTTSYMKSRKGD